MSWTVVQAGVFRNEERQATAVLSAAGTFHIEQVPNRVLSLQDQVDLYAAAGLPSPTSPVDLTPIEDRVAALEGVNVARPLILPLPVWDMSATLEIAVLSPVAFSRDNLLSAEAYIYSDSGIFQYPLTRAQDAYINPEGMIRQIQDAGGFPRFTLQRRDGGFFTLGQFSSTAASRGHLALEYLGPAV